MVAAERRYIVGIDTGGTFTDATLIDTVTNEVFIDKSPTTPHDFSLGVVNAIGEVAKWVNLDLQGLLERTRLVKHGSTVATNALLTRNGARVGLITTAGFEDTTLIMRAVGRVAGLSIEQIKHQSTATKPEPLVPRACIRGVTERIDARGDVVIPLNEDEVREALRTLVEGQEIQSLAVNLLFGFINPSHERRIKAIFDELYPDRTDLEITLSSDLAPVFREYARANTVIINAFLARTVNRYVDGLGQRLGGSDSEGGPQLLLMQANGGIVHRDEMTPVGMLQSGPAGGIIASKTIADLLGHGNVVSTDMGGTSYDLGLIVDGFWSYMREPIVERFHISWPIINIESIGAGGGTIARTDHVTRRLVVGPQSAGASPGPVCYGAGGTQPTVTDANVVLGYIDPDYFLGGRIKLQKQLSEEAIRTKIAEPLGMSVVEAAAGIYQVINGHMADLVRKSILPTGRAPSEFVMYAFGGAGPIHTLALTAATGIREIYVFPTSAVFSSFGIASADVIHTLTASQRYVMPADPDDLNGAFQDLDAKLIDVMRKEGFEPNQVQLRRTFHMRYRRQLNELAIHIPAGGYGHEAEDQAGDVAVDSPVRSYDAHDVKLIMEEFERRYEQVYGPGSGYSRAGIEVISITIDAIGPAPKPKIAEHPGAGLDPSRALRGRRPAYFAGAGGFAETAIYDYTELRPENHLMGPAIVETPVTTVVLPPGTSGTVDRYMNLALRLEA